VSAFNAQVSSAASISELFGPLLGTDRVNVVLYGYGGDAHPDGTYLADSINILSIDPATDTTTLVAIPRDLWIEGFAALPDNGKINQAFAIGYLHGGVPHAAEATTALLAGVTGLDLSYWLALDFAGFAAMVDAVHGVTVENPVAFEYTWLEDQFRAGVFPDGSFAAGTLQLNGEGALTYARTRYTSAPAEASDFARSVRQQRVLAALRTKIGNGLGSLGPGLALMDALDDRFRTNLSAIDLLLLAGHLTPDRRIELSEGTVLEGTRNSIGEYILAVIGRASGSDYAPLRAYITDALAQPIASPGPSPSGTP
jgi:LCP family protein required for cell wall assembly